jgi:hypothetical protein
LLLNNGQKEFERQYVAPQMLFVSPLCKSCSAKRSKGPNSN